MSDVKKPSDLVEAAGTLGTSLVRVSTAVVSLPFSILPDKERDEAVSAARQIFTSVGELHLGLLRATARGIGIAAREVAKVADAEAPR